MKARETRFSPALVRCRSRFWSRVGDWAFALVVVLAVADILHTLARLAIRLEVLP